MEHESEPLPLMRSPRSVDIDITSKCNLRCKYCYYFANPSVQYQDLGTEEWLGFFNELGQLGVMDVCLAGGEPFARADLPLLLKGIIRNRMRFSLLSNGSLIDDAMVSFLVESRRCDSVQISVDGDRAEIHDILRGPGAFEGAMRGIEILRRSGVNVAVRVTVHRHNVFELRRTVRFLLEDLSLPSIGTNAAGYLGLCRTNSNDVLLNVSERQLAMETLLDLAEEYEGRIHASAGPLAEGRMWDKMWQALQARVAALPGCGSLTACGCPNQKIAVRSDGAIIPCPMLPHLEMGRIGRDSLLKIWREDPILDRLRKRHLIPLSSFAFCQDCVFMNYCTGNCPGLAYSITGAVDHPSPDACLRRFLVSGGVLPKMGMPSQAQHRRGTHP